MKKEEIRRLLEDPTDEELREYHGSAQYGVTTDYIEDFLEEEFGIKMGCWCQGDNRCLDPSTAKKVILKVLDVIEE
jgi:hypothetical protein